MSSNPFPAHDDHPESSQNASKPSTGLTFVLPPLSALKAQKSKKKVKLTYEEPAKKQPRPIKLKPLKEVLSKLILQIKKKDDYAFFLQPVDPAQISGYNDVISRPMDLGTMTTKVEKGRYRSLEEFASDLKLVTSNAKTFNPAGSIYHTEADRIESYALDQISKAAATVIEYETDWNIDVEKDDELVAVDEEDVGGTPAPIDESRAGSPSAQTGGGKKSKGKKSPGTLSESLEADGGMPGAKDGLGAFPPGSDWAELMLALKLKGKRYRTKKERMRMERGGPPVAADGSVDYPEMEDPFSVLSAMVPDPPSRPLLVPLYPTTEPADPSQPPFPAPITIVPAQDIPEPSMSTAGSSHLRSIKSAKPAKRRHWIVNRNGPTRSRVKDVGDEDAVPAWRTAREPVATDFGSYTALPSVLANENKLQDVGADLGSEARLFDVLRRSLDHTPCAPSPATSPPDHMTVADEDGYWRGRAAEAETYIRDIVYGGADGFAYARSLAEFLTPSEPVQRNGEPPTYGELGRPVAQWVEENLLDPLTGGRHRVLRDAARMLTSLPLTPPQTPPSPSFVLPDTTTSTSPPSDVDIRHQIDLSLHAYPATSRALETLRAIHAEKIDLPALIQTPDELFHAEDVWAGREYREKRKREMDEALARDPEKNAAAYLQWAIAEHRQAEAGATRGGVGDTGVVEDAVMLAYALEVAADEIARFASGRGATTAAGGEGAEGKTKTKAENDGVLAEGADADGDVVMKTEDEEDGGGTAPPAGNGAPSEPQADAEDPDMKKLRLNLLALAKRAPLDQIMKLPLELVPAHLRHIVPTADA
ncbi:hypothetical protein LXA43DRAFT_1000031 [Ganoderma leucocontextum]|nr:hypothetical protein LXA43DRAFT_1000031 [Ganoderma leucocontextum]